MDDQYFFTIASEVQWGDKCMPKPISLRTIRVLKEFFLIIIIFLLQDEKNQLLTTNVWLNLVNNIDKQIMNMKAVRITSQEF